MQPTWTGFIHTTHDALIILEACLSGRLHHIPRRPHDRERTRLISSGNVFVYEENASGIKRWTDGMTWSPSRIMGNFLVYRELNPNNYATGEKKVARKRKRTEEAAPDGFDPTTGRLSPGAEEDRRLVGSLVDSYGFKPEGLVKKTLTVQYQNVVHHIISYYTTADIKSGKFRRPTHSDTLQDIIPRPELLNGNFKAPIHEAEDATQGMTSPTTSAGPAQMEFPQTFQPTYPIHNRSYSVQTYAQRPTANAPYSLQTGTPTSAYNPPRSMMPVQYQLSEAVPMTASPSNHSPSIGGYQSPVPYQNLRHIQPPKPRRSNSTSDLSFKREYSYDDYSSDVESMTSRISKRARTDTPTGHVVPPLSMHEQVLTASLPQQAHTPLDDSHVGVWSHGHYDLLPQLNTSMLRNTMQHQSVPLSASTVYHSAMHSPLPQMTPSSGYYDHGMHSAHTQYHDPHNALNLYQDPNMYAATAAGSS